MAVDYSIYLVTDSTAAILGQRDLVEVVEQALIGGVTVVQYRDKTSDTGALISTARALHAVCQKHAVPLIINDRVDVALAVGCEGVHLGQDDMNVASAREMLGPSKIIGVTVSSNMEAKNAVEAGADYLGIGTLYATNTKKNTKDIIGINGVRSVLHFLETQTGEAFENVKTVCIGGINASNLQRIKYQLYAPFPFSKSPKTIEGVAIVSAIMAAPNPTSATKHLKELWANPPPYAQTISPDTPFEVTGPLMQVHKKRPLSHNMTNLVVQHFSASVALAIGASPIMSNNGLEAADLAKLGGGLVINMGTATSDPLRNQRQAIQAYNLAGRPVILDPVGAGATSERKNSLKYLLESGYFDLIKGNEQEIMAVATTSGFTFDPLHMSAQQHGVESGDTLHTDLEKACLVERIAARERNIVLMTGAIDFISDGVRTYSIANGHAYLGMITGSGCALGTTLSAYLAASPHDKLHAAVAALCHYEIAAEYAARRNDVQGPGTFIPAFVDELFKRRMEIAEQPGADWTPEIQVAMMEKNERFVSLRKHWENLQDEANSLVAGS